MFVIGAYVSHTHTHTYTQTFFVVLSYTSHSNEVL
jgi:hypothetical protein